ncbi:hypothetical protein HDU93_001653 [Gonapodya sp. JEL0774]|nr:hypothetical protein HDU93_001653 [Gonapodya sp. JEL0774]
MDDTADTEKHDLLADPAGGGGGGGVLVEEPEEEAGFGHKAGGEKGKIDDINKGEALETIVANLGVKKNDIPWDKTIFLGLLAGFFVSQGCLFALTAGGGLPPEVRAAYPAVSKVLLGVTFPVILVVSLLNRRISILGLLRNWLLVYLSNLAACLLCGYLFAYQTEIFKNEPYLTYVSAIGVLKTTLPWHVLFLRGIPANALVCLSIFLGLAARDVTGKIVAMWIPIVTFAVIGYEHCVANMMFIPISIYYGANVSWAGFWYNQSAVVLGNIIGGGLLIGGSEYFMYHWHHSAEPEKHSGKWGAGNSGPRLPHHDSLAAIAAMNVDTASPLEPCEPVSVSVSGTLPGSPSTPAQVRVRVPTRPETIALSLTPLHVGPPARDPCADEPSRRGGVFGWDDGEVEVDIGRAGTVAVSGGEVVEVTGRRVRNISAGLGQGEARKRSAANGSANGLPAGAVAVTVDTRC